MKSCLVIDFDTDYILQVNCVAEGKPAPKVTWQKNGRKILTADSNVYQVRFLLT